MPEELSEMEMDLLAEMANIGAGNASTALSHMLSKKIQMTVPTPFVGDIAEIQRELGATDDTVLAVFLKMENQVQGAMLNIFTQSGALGFVKLLTGKEYNHLDDLGEAEKSALSEVGNVLLGSSVTALGKFLNADIGHTIPDVAVDMLAAIMDSVLLEIGAHEDKVLVFRINLHIEGESVGEDMYFLFDPKSTKLVLDDMREKIKQISS